LRLAEESKLDGAAEAEPSAWSAILALGIYFALGSLIAFYLLH
jgi:hypothetical protein